MKTKSSTYANNAAEDTFSDTPSWVPILVSLITFSNIKLSRTGDIESSYFRPDITIIRSVSVSSPFILTNVSIMHTSTSFINFYGKLNFPRMFIKLLLWILLNAYLKLIKRICISLLNSNVFWKI